MNRKSKPEQTFETRLDTLKCQLEACGLSAEFQSNASANRVFENLSFRIWPGQLICLLGPSGCGKTTLLKMIAGFISPTRGTIFLNGRPIGRPGPDRSVVFQEDALFPWLTVYENIAFGLRRISANRGHVKYEVNRVLDLVGLSEFANYLPNAISGGMKQRVALARVLVLKPRILLMDEPFGALDSQSRENMQELLLKIWSRLNQTIFFVTHDLTEAIALADRILIMDKSPGRIIKDVTIELQRPRKRESDRFHMLYKKIKADIS